MTCKDCVYNRMCYLTHIDSDEQCCEYKKIDEPKWHKVSEEGLPKGDYEGNKLFNVVVSTYNKFLKEWFTCIWNHLCSFDGVSFHYEDIDGEVYEILAEEVVAWQKITPYEG